MSVQTSRGPDPQTRTQAHSDHQLPRFLDLPFVFGSSGCSEAARGWRWLGRAIVLGLEEEEEYVQEEVEDARFPLQGECPVSALS